MKKLKSIYLLLLSVLVIGAFASCAGSTDDDDGKPDAFKGEAYFTVQVAVAGDTQSTSRAAGPQGGEDGDGRETAFENEYKVNNVCVFLYSSTTGISDGDAKIEQAFFLRNQQRMQAIQNMIRYIRSRKSNVRQSSLPRHIMFWW